MYYTIYTLCTSLCTEIEHGQELHSWHRKKYICQIIVSLKKQGPDWGTKLFFIFVVFLTKSFTDN